MTVAELIEALEGFNPSNLVVVDTLGFSRGVFPVSDRINGPLTIKMDGESYGCAILEVSEWP